jgi:hypothetical protein
MKKELNKKRLGDDQPIDDIPKQPRLTEEKKIKRFVVSELTDCWIAHDIADATSGFLLFNKKTSKYHASLCDIKLHFPRFARGFRMPSEAPVDQYHAPKGELLMLLALRKRFKENLGPNDVEACLWRMIAIKQLLYEYEESAGKSVSDRNIKIWMDIAKDETRFEKYFGEWIIGKIKEDLAGDTLNRLGNWIKKLDQIEPFTTAPHYDKFFKSVEKAAKKTGGVPIQKDVRNFFEKGLSRNQLGGETGFRSTKKQLHFDWLPTRR